jgi:propanol-preferring alcohol dehydrogenase
MIEGTMRAAVVRGFGKDLAIAQVAIPAPARGEVLIRLEASGVCHTDLHAADGDWPVKPSPPFIPGHEGVGIVVELGEGVTWIARGDRVGIAWLHDACGHCEYCCSGWETLCPTQRNTGYEVNGTFAEYVIGAASHVVPLPRDADPFALAPILCAGVTTYKGLRETEARAGQWVAISGIGGLGHLAVQYAVAMGLRVVAIDVGPDKLALAQRLGAEASLDARDDALVETVSRITGGGAHGALVTAVSPHAFDQALALVRRGGTVSLVGLPPGTFATPIFEMVLKRITVRGSIVGTRNDLREAVDFALRGKVAAQIERRRLGDVNEVFDALRHGRITGRVVLDCTA